MILYCLSILVVLFLRQGVTAAKPLKPRPLNEPNILSCLEVSAAGNCSIKVVVLFGASMETTAGVTAGFAWLPHLIRAPARARLTAFVPPTF